MKIMWNETILFRKEAEFYAARLRGLLPSEDLIVTYRLNLQDTTFIIRTPHLVDALVALRDEFEVGSVRVEDPEDLMPLPGKGPSIHEPDRTHWVETTLYYTREGTESIDDMLAHAAKTGKYDPKLVWIQSYTAQTEEYNGCFGVTGWDITVMYPSTRPDIGAHLGSPDGY